MRLFIAINFPDEIKAAIAKVRDELKDTAFRGNFTRDENLHLTLVFLGECDVQQTKAIKQVMDDTLCPNFSLTLDKAGFFKRDSGNIWWVGLKENKSLSDLQADLTNRLIQNGFALENRKFTPHVTIGREVKMPSELFKPEVQQIGFTVKSIELMQSEHIHGKLTYAAIYSCSLASQHII